MIDCLINKFLKWCAVIALLAFPMSVCAHGIAGKRFFPTTLAVDDPFVNDEFSLTTSHIKEPAQGEEPSLYATEVSAEWTKTITPRFGIFFEGEFRNLDPAGESTNTGFGNLEVGLKYQLLTSAEHEALMSIGFSAQVGDTGDNDVEAESFSIFSPSLFFGKGFGDLPDAAQYLRPLALTGVVSAAVPEHDKTITTSINDMGEREIERNSTFINWGFSVQYNFQYLESFVKDVGLPMPLNRMIPVVEFDMNTCLNHECARETSGTVNPGVIWFGKHFQLGLEAQIPINDRTGDNVGVLAQVHFFLDDNFPDSIGRPLFGPTTRARY